MMSQFNAVACPVLTANSLPLVPSHLLIFLESHFDSYEKLEIVHRIRIGGGVISRDAVRVVSMHVDALDDAIDSLERAGFISLSEDGLRLGPRAQTDNRFAELMDAYAHDHAGVMAAVSTIALRRIREDFMRLYLGRTRKDESD
jgi:hypothetical protein